MQVGPAAHLGHLEPQKATLRFTELHRCGSFKVLSSDSCSAYAAECPGFVHLCCLQEGETCSTQKSTLSEGDTCHASYEGQSQACDLQTEQKDVRLGFGALQSLQQAPLDWWPKVALSQVEKISCDGTSFTVNSGDTCSNYQAACAGVWFFCCDKAGQTCSKDKSTLYAKDTCWASYGKSCDDGPQPGPDPKPTMEPGTLKVGNWIKTWKTNLLTPEPLEVVICFSGWAKLSTALDECKRVKGSMPAGPLWLSIGGGNCDAGSGGSVAWSQEILQDFLDNIGKVDLSSYKGVMFDLETNSGGCRAAIAAGRSSACGASSGTDYGTSPSADMFVQAYKAVQALGKGVAVSWSYQMPYCMDNSAEIVNTAIHNDAVKYVSPQMYQGGKFTSNEYAPAVWNGNSKVAYTDYQNVKGEIWPSYTLADFHYDTSENLKTMGTMQQDMKAWAKDKNIQAFIESPGCVAYQNQ